ncbi:MAG: FmdB family zinc ribbon protein [Candidatus Marinimicrobia bacterium]|nr:FmdB family zinc ribbon protein [Candidatus Neomarinimicrobiota bacterium]
MKNFIANLYDKDDIMPTYEYVCLKCGYHFDAFQKMSEAHLDKCIKCQGSVRRVVSGGSGLIFKGSGFYITDYTKGSDPKKTTGNENRSKKSRSESKPVSSAPSVKKAATNT